MRALCVCLLLASVLSSGYSWTLSSTVSNVIPEFTTNVSLQCLHENQADDKEPFGSLLRIRLLKQVRSNEWTTYAQIVNANPSKPTLHNPNQPGVSVSGYLGQPNKSYLSVTWSNTSFDTVGSFQCEIDGYIAVSGDNKQKFTEVVNITNHVTVNDINSIINQLERLLEERNKLQDAQIQKLEKRINNKDESIAEENYCETRDWPGGKYALMTDAYGCPNTPFSTFSAGHINIQTKTDYRPHHVFPPRFHGTQYTNTSGRNVLRFDFCEMNNDGKLDWIWPRGSYCVADTGHCQSPFKYGYIKFYLDSLVQLSVTSESLPRVTMVTHGLDEPYISVSSCCRNDGDANTPMPLPNTQPFYLYRYGGTCQTVYDMDVTNVTIKLDTDGTGRDSFFYPHADGTINKGSINLCYYTRTKRSP